jgi:hypothetical protein
MSTDHTVPDIIYIVTDETQETTTSTQPDGSKSSFDIGPLLGSVTPKEKAPTQNRHQISVEKLKQEIKGFVLAIEKCLDEADSVNSKIRLDEVEVAVEINAEGQLSIFGLGTKTGAKSSLTFKFKR